MRVPHDNIYHRTVGSTAGPTHRASHQNTSQIWETATGNEQKPMTYISKLKLTILATTFIFSCVQSTIMTPSLFLPHILVQ